MPTDALYWNSISFGSDESIRNQTPPRDYIDPWDLENYAYIRDQLNSTESSSSDEGSSSEFPVDSNFYYVSPGTINPMQYNPVVNSPSGNYAAIEEVDGRVDDDEIFYESGKVIPRIEPEMRIASQSTNGVIRRTSMMYGFDSGTKERQYSTSKSAVPLSRYRDRSTSFSGGDYSLYDVSNGRHEDGYMKSSSDVPIYDYIRTSNKPHNFGLSKYGHLQIDYSCSWINLDKYIYN